MDGQRVWVRARPLLTIALSLALLGCSSGKPDAGGHGSPEQTTTTTAGGGPAPTGVDAPTTTTSSATGAPAVRADPAARAALDAYLAALGANDFATALRASRDAVQSLTEVRSIVAQGNVERGGKTTTIYKERSLRATSATADEVHFVGRVTLTSTVSGSSGSPVGGR